MGPARFHCATLLYLIQKDFVRREIRTPAHRSGLRPERSALDHSAILTYKEDDFFGLSKAVEGSRDLCFCS